MTGHTRWSVLKVKTMLRHGWEVWEAPNRTTVWARLRPGSAHLEVQEIAADELEVVDDVLRDGLGEEPQCDDQFG